uniref:Uncharacterized protein n=1 Tax=Oryza glumipatula TaxID=40148 RepID=A0A0D9YIE4_9ORYZ
MARIIRRHGGGRILRRSREEKRRLSEGGGGASQQPQGPAEDDYCPVIGSKINMDGISDQEVANAYSFVFSFDEALRSIKLEEGRLLIHIADLYEMKRSLDDKITSLKAAVKSSPSADIFRRIKSTRTKNNETQEEIYSDKSLLAKTRLKLVKLEARHRASTLIVSQDESPRSWRISIDEVAVVADSDGDADVNAEQLLHLLEHVGAIGENTPTGCGGTKYEPLIGSDPKAIIRRYRQLLGMVPHHDREVEGSELKHADDAPPLNTDGDHWHYRRRSREDEAAPFPPSSIRGSPIRRNISIQIPSPGTRDEFGTHGGRRQLRPCQKYKSGRIASRRRRGAEREQLPLENTSKDTHKLAAPAAAPDGTRPPTDMTQNSKSSAVSFVTKPLAAASARGSGTTPAMT